jgi:hypothetical protein
MLANKDGSGFETPDRFRSGIPAARQSVYKLERLMIGEGSCVIHLRGPRAGHGYDHATGECAGPIDLIHHATGLGDAALFDEAAMLSARCCTTPVSTSSP